MNQIISPESYKLLKCFNNDLAAHDETLFNEACIQQLLENGFIESHISGYYLDGSSPIPTYSNYAITEKGKGYIAYRKYEEEFRSSVKEIASSAKIQSNLALQKSKKADIKSWISIVFTGLGLLIEIIINFKPIVEFLSNLF